MIPWLEFEAPFCAVCEERTYDSGDGFRCDDCRIEWDHEDGRGRLDDDVVRCGEASDLVVSPTSIPICVRPAGHGGYVLDGVRYRQHAGYDPGNSWSSWTTREVSA